MPLTNEQIEALLSKDIKSKTILVTPDKLQATIEEHLNDGWKLEKKAEVNGRYKVTFTKIK